jgi:glycosyltransferase involved in cell wall biosynthesis
MKITLVTPVYGIAGVPLAQIRFAKALAARGHNVDLIVGHVPPHLTFPEVGGVNVIIMNRTHVRGMLFPLWQYLRMAKPDVVFSAEDHLNAVVLFAAIAAGSKAKISGSSRVLPTDRQAYSTRFISKGSLLKLAMKLLMRRADALTCVSKDMVAHYRRIFRNAPHLCVYNIIVDSTTTRRMLELMDHDWLKNKTCPVIVAAGTFTRRKGFADLIQAMGFLSQRRQLRLIILGDGSLRTSLELQAQKLGVDDRVSFPGNVANPLKYFHQADVFVLSSYAEGMPNVLVEAMACGCTPVSTDCPTGPRELLQGGKFGYLVPMRDAVAMAAGIEQALDSPISKSLLAVAVRPFHEEAVIARHFEVLGLTR